jgi:DNA-binding transcriptional ArsR family regulator
MFPGSDRQPALVNQTVKRWTRVLVNQMVKERRVDLDAVFAALAHPIRRSIVERLAEGDCTVGDLAAPHDVSMPAISRHLRVLEEAGLLEQTPDGRVRRCALKAQPLSAAFGWLVQYRLFWEDALDAMARHLERKRP